MRLGLLLHLFLSFHLAAGDGEYSIQFLCDEDATTSPIFSIIRVEPTDGGLRLFLGTSDPSGVADLLANGALEAQLSDHRSETATSPSISLGKAVWCTDDGPAVYLDFASPLPECDGKPPVKIEYFFTVPVTLGPDRDLVIGQDPDFLWVIEEIGISRANRGL
jgi:hypothetical protein